MAKNSIPEYDSTESNNTDIGGTSTLGGIQTGSKLDDIIRRLMAHLKNFQMGPTFGGQVLAPLSTTYPTYSFSGDTDTGVGQGAANTVSIYAANATTPRMTVSATSVAAAKPLSVNIAGVAPIYLNDSSAATNEKSFRMANLGGTFFLQTMDDADTTGNQAINVVRGAGTAVDSIKFFTGSSSQCGKFASTGSFQVGDSAYTGTDITDPGINLGGPLSIAPGAISATTSGSAAIFLNRQGGAGNLVEFYVAASFQGAISASGGTVTYGTFCGSHWSQMADLGRPDILRGSLVETIDDMCEWADENTEHLPRFKISDSIGSPSVYGVFMDWRRRRADKNDLQSLEIDTSDASIASLGAYMVRVSAGETVKRGDLIESAGNGCGKVQSDGIMRASTVAKVTSPRVIETYPDGSYLVPATIHCG